MKNAVSYSDFFLFNVGVLPALFKEYRVELYGEHFTKIVMDTEHGLPYTEDIPFDSEKGRQLLQEIIATVDTDTLLYELADAYLHHTTNEEHLYRFVIHIVKS